MAQETSDTKFEQEVIQASASTPVLVDFWAEWCGPCRQLAPIIDEISEEMEGKLTVYKINIDKNPETPAKYNVRGIPTLIVFKDGKTVATKVGSLPKSALLEWVQNSIAA
jgi:thioredoxin 1